MTSYGYIIMIIVESCMIYFNFDCIMQLKNSYHIATNVCSRKSATTFCDLPDWLRFVYIVCRDYSIGVTYMPITLKSRIFVKRI